ncbi:unnamed protein product [Linum tenue]|uniref:Uncharacterized protein n=1 Tax=Linum tenue TaxID=586396 RepID=A0AAV0JNV0_9ROSI|nr:unnamed protein product [Linum tenue]
MNRDAYGFAVRPQHIQRYRQYANIYKEEEEERSDRWKSFLDRLAEPAQRPPVNGSPSEEATGTTITEATEEEADDNLVKETEGDSLSDEKRSSDVSCEDLTEKEEKKSKANRRIHRIQIWTETRQSLRVIEDLMSVRVKKKPDQVKEQQDDTNEKMNNQRVILKVHQKTLHLERKNGKGRLKRSQNELCFSFISSTQLDTYHLILFLCDLITGFAPYFSWSSSLG